MADRRAPPARGAVAPRARPGPPPPLDAGAALFLDIDGTLLDLALTPSLVRVDDDVAERCCRRSRARSMARSR